MWFLSPRSLPEGVKMWKQIRNFANESTVDSVQSATPVQNVSWAVSVTFSSTRLLKAKLYGNYPPTKDFALDSKGTMRHLPPPNKVNARCARFSERRAYLSRYDGATQHELVKATQMKGSTVSVAITKMEKEGFVKRVQDEYDMRATRVFLTKKGLEISNSHKNLLSKTDETIMKDIPERDERVAMYVLEKMLDNLVEN